MLTILNAFRFHLLKGTALNHD